MKNSYSSGSYHPQTLRFAGVVTLLFLFALARVFRPMSDWVYTQWLFSYQYGFVKRGLHGEILRWLGLDGSYPVIVMLAAIFLIAASILMLRMFMILLIGNQNLAQGGKHLLSSPPHVAGWLFFLLALFHSATFQMLFYNLGRLEHIQLVLTVGCLLLMLRIERSDRVFHTGSPFTRWGLFLAVSVTIIVSLLIHEAFYFFFLPLLFMAWIYTDRGTTVFNILRVALFICASILTWAITVHGTLNIEQYYPYMEAMREQYGVRADYDSLIVVFRDTSMNLEYTRGWLLSSPRIPIYTVFFLMILSPFAILIWKLYKPDIQYGYHMIINGLLPNSSGLTPHKKRLFRAGIILSCFSPLCLIPIGFDLFRWFGLTILNLFIMTSFLSADTEFRSNLISVSKKYWYLIVLSTGLSILLGGMDVFISFSNEVYFTEWIELILN
jgi:hypothetical protein